MKKLFYVLAISWLFIVHNAFSQSKPNIYVLATGGTIAGQAKTASDSIAYTSAVTSVDKLLAAVPELSEQANIKGEQVAQIGSQDMTDDVWLTLAKRVNQLLSQDDIDGVVITHGTDTMEETAYFLNLVVKSDKPVVLVGAMRPGTALSADGPMNIYNAVATAISPESKARGVVVVLNDTIHSARHVSKTSTILTNAFTNHDFGAIGYVLQGKPRYYVNVTQPHTVQSEFDISKLDVLPKVDIVYSYANTDAGTAVKALQAAGAQGIIHAGTGNGSVHKYTLPALQEARKAGVVIVRSSRVGGGMVARNGELSDDEHDFIVADSLNPQKARILLQLILTKYKPEESAKIQEMFWRY